uniref:Uncharacterized protein n=1 Tax=Leersia perrieri TaxID=77586 RepID=A0A0D9WE77_9ORYZ
MGPIVQSNARNNTSKPNDVTQKLQEDMKRSTDELKGAGRKVFSSAPQASLCAWTATAARITDRTI